MNNTEANLDLLNQVQEQIIKVADTNKVNLKEEFGTVAEFKKFVFSFTVRAIMETGISLDKAYDLVMGNGAYDSLADEVWNTLNP